MPAEIINISNVPKIPKKFIIWIVVAIVLLLVILPLVLDSFVLIPTGSRGVVTKLGKATGQVMNPGLNFKIPWITDVVPINVRTQVVKFDNGQREGDNTESSSMFTASKDLQDVQIASVTQYHIKEDSVVDIFSKYGSGNAYRSNVIEPVLREVVKSKSSLFTAEELVTKRIKFADEVTKTLVEKFKKADVIFERFSVVNFEFSEEYAQSIEQKQVAAQEARKAEYQLLKAQKEAEAIKVQAAALAQNKELVEWEAVKKWDGKLPQVTGGSVPFINIKQ